MRGVPRVRRRARRRARRAPPPAPPAAAAPLRRRRRRRRHRARSPAEPSPWSGFDAAATTGAPDIGVAAVLPDTPTQPVATEPVWVEPTTRAGDVPCRQCGTPNGPDRNFCRHCGASLTGQRRRRRPPRTARCRGGVAGRDRRKAKAARTDPTDAAPRRAHALSRGGMSGRSMLFRTGGIVIILGGLLAFLGPWRATVINRGREALGASRFEDIDADRRRGHLGPGRGADRRRAVRVAGSGERRRPLRQHGVGDPVARLGEPGLRGGARPGGVPAGAR